MARHPLLVFPERTKRHGGGGNVRLPTSHRQAGRLAPQFQRLQQAMDRQRLALQDNPLGLQPEQALVLETIGPVQDFVRAVKKVQGLEWLGEFELDDIAPDYGFEDEKDPEKQLKGQLFLVMTDQRALQGLQSLFGNWQHHPEIKFPHGQLHADEYPGHARAEPHGCPGSRPGSKNHLGEVRSPRRAPGRCLRQGLQWQGVQDQQTEPQASAVQVGTNKSFKFPAQNVAHHLSRQL